MAISGNAGTGKDYITRHLLVPMLTNGLPYIIASFADHFKVEGIIKEKLDRKKVYGRKDKHTRVRLQLKGTEEGRNVYGPNVWVDILNERLIQYEERGIEYVFITDCRFPNEIEYIRSKQGVIIRIEAPDRHAKAMAIENGSDVTVTTHLSETAVSEYKGWDYVVDNTEDNAANVADAVRDICLSLREHWKYPETVFCDLDDTLVECTTNYIEIRDQVRKFFLDNNVMTPFQFDSTFEVENAIRFQRPFSREGYAEMFVDFLGGTRSDLAQKIREIAMGIHEQDFPLKSEETLEFIRKINKETHLVIVTLGDPVDQIRKLYKIGFTDVKTECVVRKDVYTYAALMRKYPSVVYRMIGDSIQSDILPARQAGIKDVFLVSRTYPITSIPFYQRQDTGLPVTPSAPPLS